MLQKYVGLACIAVQCTSPNGVRQIVYRYHYTPNNDSHAQARQRALHRQGEYMLMGWRAKSRLELP